jgi:hypothetical protein
MGVDVMASRGVFGVVLFSAGVYKKLAAVPAVGCPMGPGKWLVFRKWMGGQKMTASIVAREQDHADRNYTRSQRSIGMLSAARNPRFSNIRQNSRPSS